MREKMLKQFSHLATGELTAVVVFAIVVYLLVERFPELRLLSHWPFWSAFLTLEFILLQGSLYWFLKYRSLQMKSASMPSGATRSFRILQILDLGLIGLSLILFIVGSFRELGFPAISLAISIFVLLFAIAEYVNYFHYQLSYKMAEWPLVIRSGRLKKSCLSKDFREKK